MPYNKTFVFLYKLHPQILIQVKEKIKQLIAEHLIRQAQLKLMLSNLNAIDSLTDDYQNKILDEIIEIDKSVMKLREILKIIE